LPANFFSDENADEAVFSLHVEAVYIVHELSKQETKNMNWKEKGK
jgi:hypothetical protein